MSGSPSSFPTATARDQARWRGGVMTSTRPQPTNEFRWVEVQRFRQANEVAHRDIAPALLQRADVRAVEVRPIGELFLRQPELMAPLAHPSTELAEGWVIGRH
jgi:hypothetical protein